MRHLMLFSIGFSIACIIGAYLLSGIWLLYIAIVFIALALVLFLLKRQPTAIAGMLLLGCVIGLVWNWGYDALYLDHARAYDGKTVQTQFEIVDYSYETDYGVVADGKCSLSGKSYRVRIYINEDTALRPGDRVTGSFRLRFTANGGEKEPTYHQGNGTFLLAYEQESPQIHLTESVPVKFFAATARKAILDRLDILFEEDTVGFARALLLGETSKLSYDVDADFRTSGIRHVVAVSGLHVSILFSVIYLFGGRNKVVGVVLGFPLLFAFAAIAGFGPSIVRACVMQAMMLLSRLIDKEYDPPTALSLPVLLMLVINPLTITSVSFQLSVGCVVGMILLYQKIHDTILRIPLLGGGKGKSIRAKLIRGFVGSVSVTLSTMITTLPLCAYYFEVVSLVSILTNLLTLPVVSLIFYGIMLACIAGVIWLPLGKLIAWLASWLMRYVMMVADLLSKIPMAAVYTSSAYIVVWLILCYVLLAVLLLSKKKHPFVMTGCILGLLSFAILASYVEPYLDQYRFTALNVGQGQCLLLQSRGKNYIIDCGGDLPETAADEAAKALLSNGVTRLDGLVLTHYDADHANGALLLLQRVNVDTLYLPVTAEADQMQLFAESYKEKIQWIRQDTQITDRNITITLFPAETTTSGNESSMCVLCQVQNCDILITGDRDATGERQLIQNHALPDLEVLVVGHHGSKTATSLELLSTTMPDIAIISVKENNRYGHPAQEVLDRLYLFDCIVLSTAEQGAVIIKG